MMKIALVHDWLIHMRGGEKVLEAMAEMFPEATIYTLFYDREKLSPALKQMKIKASFLHHWPGIRRYYRWLLPLMPWAVRSLGIGKADLVISSSHCVAKAVPIPEGAFHLCYCHTPMRYLWGFEDEYFGKFSFVARPFIKMLLSQLKEWDRKTSESVHQFISNSENVRQRIQDFYNRDARVVHPPVDLKHYQPLEGVKGDYYLAVSHFVPYKRLDLVIEAFNELDRQLIIVGAGPCEKAYRKLRKSEKISFLGPLTEASLKELYANARALIFPTEEDFGIVPLEAQACGTPVIAFARGGALESVKTGIFFEEQNPEAIRKAVLEFERMHFDPVLTANNMAEFGKDRFKEKMEDCLREIEAQRGAYAAL